MPQGDTTIKTAQATENVESITLSNTITLPDALVPDDDKAYKCIQCDYSTVKKHYLRQHIDLVHNDERPFKCPLCDYAGKRSHSLKEHLVVHSDIRLHRCNQCNATFRKKGHLTNHYKMHSAASSAAACSLCQSPFSKRTELYEHLRDRHGGSPGMYPCTKCEYATTIKCNLTMHEAIHNDGATKNVLLMQPKLPPSTSIILKCAVCGFETTTKKVLEEHVLGKHVDKPQNSESVTFFMPGTLNPSHIPAFDSKGRITNPTPEDWVRSKNPVMISNASNSKKSEATNAIASAEVCDRPSSLPVIVERMEACEQDILLSLTRRPSKDTREDDSPETEVLNLEAKKKLTVLARDSVSLPDNVTSLVTSGGLLSNVTPRAAPPTSGETTSSLCRQCGYKCNDASQLMLHIIDTHKQTSSRPAEGMTLSVNAARAQKSLREKNTDSEGSYRCNICGYICSMQRTIKAHMWKHSGHQGLQYPTFQNPPRTVMITSSSNASTPTLTVSNNGLLVKPTPSEQKANTSIIRVIDESLSEAVEGKLQKDMWYSASQGPEHAATVKKLHTYARVSTALSSPTSTEQQCTDTAADNVAVVNVASEEVADTQSTTPDPVEVIVTTTPRNQLSPPLLARFDSKGRITDPTPEEKQRFVTQIESLQTKLDSSPMEAEKETDGLQVLTQVCETVNRPAAAIASRETEESAATILSLLRTGPNINPACPPSTAEEPHMKRQKLDESDSETVVTSTTNSESSSTQPPKKGGICSSLLAVIEQLRERQGVTEGEELSPPALSKSRKRKKRTGNPTLIKKEADSEGLLFSTIHPNAELLTEGSDETTNLYRCKLCHYKSSALLMKQHLKIHKSKMPYECSLCAHVAVSSEELQDHMITHCKVRSFECKRCNVVFRFKSQLRAHTRVHEDGQAFYCDICEYATSRLSAFKDHMTLHPDKLTSFSCIACREKFSVLEHLQQHMTEHCVEARLLHGSDEKGDPSQAASASTTVPVINNTRLAQAIHVKTSGSLVNTSTSPPVTAANMVCVGTASNPPGHSTAVSPALAISSSPDGKTANGVHESEPKTTLQCDQCDFIASGVRSLKSHLKRHVNDKRYIEQPLEQYKCNICGYVCHHLPSLKSHMWRHANNNSFSYAITDSLSNTTTPMDSAGNSLVTLRCCQCGFETLDKAVLGTHMKTHWDLIKRTFDFRT